MGPIAASLLIEQLQTRRPFNQETFTEMNSLAWVIKDTLKGDEKKKFSKNWKELKVYVQSEESAKVLESVNKIIKMIKPLKRIPQPSFFSFCFSLSETCSLFLEAFATVHETIQDSPKEEKKS